MTRLSVRLRHCLAIGFAALLIVASSDASGQNRTLLDLYRDSPRTVPRTSISRMSEEASQFEELSSSLGALAPLEGAVDPSTYIVGPNDQFTVTIGGLEPVVTPTVVSSDGMLLLPGIGNVEAAGRTLGAVIESARARLKDAFRNVETDLALSRPREFYVHVTGAVPEPGRYLAMPVARVEDVLKQAFFSRTLETPTANADFRPALRNVHIRRADGTEVALDLVRYYRTGDVRWNPYVLDGDAILVPAFEATTAAVFIDGDVPFPGTYDFRPGDTVLDLLLLGAGESAMADNVVVQHTRRDADGSSVSDVYTMRELRTGEPVAVHPLDHVHVPQSNPTQGLASVTGWVQFPGRYPIVRGHTTLTDLVAMAGGLREGALLRAAYLERDLSLVPKRRDVLSELELYERERDARQGGRWEILTDSSSALWKMRLGDLDFMSRYYLARWLRMDNRVSADVEGVLSGDTAPPVYLENGDRLVVPRDENAVYVIGEVIRPGRVPFMAGANGSHYVSTAGGMGPEASGTYVIRAGTGQILSGDHPVFSGDYVFVDREGSETANVDAERLRIQLEDQGLRRFQVVLQTVGTVLSIVTTALLIENALGN